MTIKTISLVTDNKEEFINITSIIDRLITKEDVKEGTVHVFVPHTTAGLMINECADPNVAIDLKEYLDILVPSDRKYLHKEGNSSAHIKAIITGSCLNIPVLNSKMLLGTWQGIFFCEFDGPRNRSIHISI